MPRKITAFPYWRDNPYLNLLYLAARADGAEIRQFAAYSSAIRALEESDDRDIFHLHWTSPICQRAIDESDAASRRAAFVTALTEAQARGTKFVWTIHNVLPHDMKFAEAEIGLHRDLAQLVDVAHVMSPVTSEAVGPHYTLPPDRVVRIPHSSYAGIYGRPPERAIAREELGVDTSSTAVLFFGQMRPYKGVLKLLAAMEQAAKERDDLVLLLAGKTTDEDRETIERHLPNGVTVIRRHEFIPDAEAATWFAAADVAVFPYEKILNSGSVLMSATLGLPCILPAEPELVSQYEDQPWVSYFDPADAAGSLGRRIAEWSSVDEEREAALTFAASYTPFDMANEYAELVSRL